MTIHCPACQQAVKNEACYVLRDVPTQSVRLIADADEARRFPCGDLYLLQCDACGMLFNSAFEPHTQRWDPRYEETQAYSQHFSQFAEQLAEQLIARWGLQNKRILELGCGKGHFLAALCRDGRNQGLGVDPAYDPARKPAGSDSVRFESTTFRREHLGFKPDLIICRHTLEHMADPATLLSPLTFTHDVPVFIDVPNLGYIHEEGAFWDLYYEHCNYFSAHSLRVLLARFGIVCDEISTGFQDQYLMAFGRTGAANPEPLNASATPDFCARMTATIAAWERQLQQLEAEGKSVVLWGGGSRAVAFLSSIADDQAEQVQAVVDINPHKQGHFLPGTGHPVLSPEQLVASPPDFIIVLNPAYHDEIAELLAGLGVRSQLLDVNLFSASALALSASAPH